MPGEPTEEQQLSEPVQLPNPKDSLREDELAPQPKRKRVNPSPEQVSRQRPKRQRRRLTKENLKTLRREAAVVELPAALDEWSLILQGSPKSPHEPRPPSEPKYPPNNIVAMEANKQSTEPKKTGRTMARTVYGGLQDNPRRYATRMRNEHGVQSYGFFPVRGSRSQKEKGLASAHFPSNFDDIQTTLLKGREDLPSHFQFLRFCQRSSRSPNEAQMNEVFGHFLDLDQWQEARHYYGRETLLVPHQDLPQPQSKILPDLVIGIDPESLGIHLWVQKHLCSHVQSQTAVCVNGLVEYKSLEGSLSTAVRLDPSSRLLFAVGDADSACSEFRIKLQRHCSAAPGWQMKNSSMS